MLEGCAVMGTGNALLQLCLFGNFVYCIPHERTKDNEIIKRTIVCTIIRAKRVSSSHLGYTALKGYIKNIYIYVRVFD